MWDERGIEDAKTIVISKLREQRANPHGLVFFSQIEGTGYRQLREGQLVDFRWRPALQDSWHCVAEWVRPL